MSFANVICWLVNKTRQRSNQVNFVFIFIFINYYDYTFNFIKIKRQIEDYLAKTKKPLICVVWPTASWKTWVAIDIAKKYNWELINADSKQIYKWIECITGLDYEEISEIKNHLFWVREINEVYTLKNFILDVTKIIIDIQSKWKIPILVWWTWLFITALTEWYEIPANSISEDIKKSFVNKTNKELYEMLNEIDPISLEKIHVNNRRRLERALEVALSWNKISDEKKEKEKIFNPFIVNIDYSDLVKREALYEKINKRQRIIFEDSLSEIKEILKKWYDKKIPAMTAIGIAEIDDYIKGNLSKEESIAKMQQSARNYAKRQITWWRWRPCFNYTKNPV